MLVKVWIDAPVDFVEQVVKSDDVASCFEVAEKPLHQLGILGLFIGLSFLSVHALSVDNGYLGVA